MCTDYSVNELNIHLDQKKQKQDHVIIVSETSQRENVVEIDPYFTTTFGVVTL